MIGLERPSRSVSAKTQHRFWGVQGSLPASSNGFLSPGALPRLLTLTHLGIPREHQADCRALQRPGGKWQKSSSALPPGWLCGTQPLTAQHHFQQVSSNWGQPLLHMDSFLQSFSPPPAALGNLQHCKSIASHHAQA